MTDIGSLPRRIGHDISQNQLNFVENTPSAIHLNRAAFDNLQVLSIT
jgi:hypothetical protein